MKLVTLLAVICCVNAAMSITVGYKAETKKMVCYYGSWAVYRNGNGKFDVENLDPSLCTHLIFGFAGLESNNTIKVLDPYNELYDNYGKGAYLRFTGLKKVNPALKTILAIGGWNEGSTKYSKMVSDAASRAVFIESVVELLVKFNFDGLDFDWEYPANRGGSPDDKVNFITCLSEMKEAFAPHGFMLTAAVSAGKSTMDTGYDVPAMSRIFDQIHIMAYDFHGTFETFTGHNAPLFGNPNIESGDQLHLNVDFAVKNWIANGASPSKLILGMPLYGHGFTLSNSNKNGLYEPAYQAIPAGPYTGEAGTWGYNEVCERFAADPGWTIVRDSYYQAPYAYKGDLWIGYDDKESLMAKAEYAMSMNLGGSMVWSIDTDDFHGICDGTTFPMIKAIKEAMDGSIIVPTTPTMGPTTIHPTTVSTEETTTSGYSTTPGPVTTPNPICKSAGLFPDDKDCSVFYQCSSNGEGGWVINSYNCPPETAFNPSISMCDWAFNVPGCEP